MPPQDDSFLSLVRQGVALRSTPGQRGSKVRRLLDNEELNLGHSIDVPPAAPFDPANPLPTIGVPQRALDLRSDSNLAQFSTITFSILPIVNGLPMGANIAADDEFNPGPFLGIVEFGNGSGFSTVEIDIPVGNYSGNSRVSPNWFLGDVVPIGGTSVSVPGSSVRAFVRNDGNYVPGSEQDNENPVGTNQTAKVMAHISYGIRPTASKNTRTYWLAVSDTLAGIGANVITLGIPPFARSFKVVRSLDSGLNMPPLSILIRSPNSGAMDGPIHVLVDVDCPEISLPNCARSITITISNAAAEVTMAVVFEIGL